MKLIVGNNRYFVSGGPERYLFALQRLLEARGHEVVPFSVNYARTVPNPYQEYFVDPPTDHDEVLIRDTRMTPGKALRLAARAVYSPASRRALSRLIREVRPDGVYLLHTANFLSPSVIDAAWKANVPVVVRLSDFHLLAPCYHFLRDGRVCELCGPGNLLHAVRYRCLQDSRPVSLVRIAAMYFHRLIRLHGRVRAFVAPSVFLRDKMVEFGVPASRIHVVPTFVDTDDGPQEMPENIACRINDRNEYPQARPMMTEGMVDATATSPCLNLEDAIPDRYFVYFGRISPEKGLEVLLSAYGRLVQALTAEDPPGLVIAGSPAPDEDWLSDQLPGKARMGLRYVGFRAGADLRRLVSGALASVLPSLCYENSPVAVLESMAWGTPVLASRLGSLPESVQDDRTGILFEPGDPVSLCNAMVRIARNPEWAATLGRQGAALVRERHSPDGHYHGLLRVFEDAGIPIGTRYPA